MGAKFTTWSQEELAVLFEEWGEKTPDAIGRKIVRTTKAVQAMAKAHRLTYSPTSTQCWLAGRSVRARNRRKPDQEGAALDRADPRGGRRKR